MEKTLFFISEMTSPVFSETNKLNIIYESRNSDGFIKGFKARPLLQDGKINGNKRLYERPILTEITEQLKNNISKFNGSIIELMHPEFTGDEKSFKARILIPNPKNGCAMLRDISLNNDNQIFGLVESMKSFNGPEFTKLIIEDKYNMGFSLRMLGGIKPHPTIEGVTLPVKPLQVVTYDAVTNPSHSDSKIIQFLTEDTKKYLGAIDMISNEVITESTRQEILLKENLQLPNTYKETIEDYLHKVINQKIYDCEGNLRFNI